MPSWTVHRIARIARFVAAVVVFAAMTLLAVPRALSAADFPPITAEEKAVKSIAGAANAPAVILFHNGEFQMLDLAQHEVSSRLTVQNRVKILTEEGKS